MKSLIASLTLLLGLAPSAAASEPLNPFLPWLAGCWQSQSGDYREVWSRPEGWHLFGYAVSLDSEGKAQFFEQMRIDVFPDDSLKVIFNAYPKGVGPSQFADSQWGYDQITFENPAHDYPQRIKYWRVEDELFAEISLIDGSQARQFEFVPCSGR